MTGLTYQCFSKKHHLMIFYVIKSINSIAKSSTFFFFFCIPPTFALLQLSILLYFIAFSSLPFFLCFLNLFKMFLYFPSPKQKKSISATQSLCLLMGDSSLVADKQSLVFVA